MTRILGLVLFMTLAASGSASAKTYGARHARLHVFHASTHVRHARTHVRRAHRLSTRHRLRLTHLAASAPERSTLDGASRLQEAATGPSEHPGWFKGRHEAGWGFSNGRATTVVGLYQRPQAPGDLPENQVYHHDSRGAAGLSVSFKLGQ